MDSGKLSTILYSNKLDVKKFENLLSNNDQGYKFFWLEAILKLIAQNKQLFTFEDVIDEMIVGAWRMVTHYHLRLGHTVNGNAENFLEHAIRILYECSKEKHMEKDQTAIGVFYGEEVIGFITVSHNIFGNTAKYVELVCFQVSEPYRGMEIGKALFYQACEEARRLGADKLYISAHSSKESQAAYKALGCVHAKEINQKLAEEEPCDVQLEYVLD